MGKWMDFDPANGLVETNVYDEQSDILTVAKSQEMQPLIDRNTELRNTKATDAGIGKGLWLYASIPTVVQLELLQKGLSVHNRHHRAAILEEINSNYPYLKTTTKTHSRKRSRPKPPGTSKPRGPYVIVR